MKALKILLFPLVLTFFLNGVVSAKNITGTWQGYFASNLVSLLTDITIMINQTGNTFTGNVSNSNGLNCLGTHRGGGYGEKQ